MSLIEGIGEEVTYFFLAVIAGIIAYVAWWSTNISEQRQFRTVLLLDRRRHPTRSILSVRVPSRQLRITEGTLSNSTSAQTENSTDSAIVSETNSEPHSSSAEPKSNIVPSTSQTKKESENSENSENPGPIDLINLEENEIIETMDADTQNEIRQRRLAHFEGSSTHGNNHPIPQSVEEQIVVQSRISNLNSSTFNSSSQLSDSSENIQHIDIDSPNIDKDNINIKLKYINDDIRIVDGRLEELLGDFKRRHFEEEINANKAVKLIFQGQVLKQDRNSLQSCGLFDNCVVHCLVHQKRPSFSDRGRSQDNSNETNPSFLRDNSFLHVTNVNNNQGVDWDLGNFLFALLSFILLAAWYFRYVYAHLYTVTATVGLIIITGVFSIVLLGAYFPDNDLPDANLRIRVTRTERVQQ